jgi:hypothetical protein
MKAIERYNWPGNIRELQNFIERSVVLTRGAELRAPVAELTNRELPGALADAEKAHIKATLRETNCVVGGRNGAAARLGLNRTTHGQNPKARNFASNSGTEYRAIGYWCPKRRSIGFRSQPESSTKLYARWPDELGGAARYLKKLPLADQAYSAYSKPRKLLPKQWQLDDALLKCHQSEECDQASLKAPRGGKS